MMTCSPMETYWGWKVLDPTPEEAKLLGVEGDYLAHGIDHEDVGKVLTRISRDGTLNARQTMEAAKGAFSEGASPVFPPDVAADTFGQINVDKRGNKNEQPSQDHPIGYAKEGTPTGETFERTPARVGPEGDASSGPEGMGRNVQPFQDHPIGYVYEGTPTGETSKRTPTRVGPYRGASSASEATEEKRKRMRSGVDRAGSERCLATAMT